MDTQHRRWFRLRALRQLGPGLITGAADDDPSGIATYSQAGAQFGYSMLWTMVFTLPLMTSIQIVSGRIGYVTGRGLAANIKRAFPQPVLLAVVGLLVLANTLNIAADFAAMAEALRLLLGGSAHVYAVTFGLASLLLQVFLPYRTYVAALKWLTLALLAYVGVAFMVHLDWREVLRRIALPQLAPDRDTLLMVVAVFGTTISPYLFFWQAAQEVESKGAGRHQSRAEVRRYLRRIKWDTRIGMLFSNLVAFFIILATAATLHAAGGGEIQTSAQAAEALRPVAGEFAFAVFAMGIIGTGLLAVPVLAGSAAYAVSELFGWKEGLSQGFRQARGFYLIIIAATGVGTAMGIFQLDPMRALVWSAMVNGVISVPIMVVLMLIGQSKKLMGTHTISARHRWLGWAATGVMAAAVAFMAVTRA